ncbi:MAG: hypothetical protein HY721_03425 [Planctomycetes bacterium]|nr:hypothetical protein [Planctomycetota bacterium]
MVGEAPRLRRRDPGGIAARALLVVLPAGLPGCAWLGTHRTPARIERWQDPAPPARSLAEKAALYQGRLEARHLTPAGVLKYRIELDRPDDGSYGNLADGLFHTGIYLASQAMRYAATRDPAAREQVLRALAGVELLHDVTGARGLFARHVSPAGKPYLREGSWPAKDWRPSATRPAFVWRGDVSKDQYAGFVHGAGVALALVDDPEVRARVGRLAAAAADHLMEHPMRIVDADGRRTTHGNLSGRVAGVPIGVNALIALAIAKVAAVAADEPRHRAFYDRLVEQRYPEIAYWAHFTVLGVPNRVNDNMAYLALHPLLLLEKDRRVLEALAAGERRTWRAVRDDRNAFFAFVHALRDPGGGAASGVEALREFPEDKVEWPVDLTREGFDFPRALLNTRKGEPRTTRGVPLHLRARSSSFWASDPFRLAGNLARLGDRETSGQDYLLAYWMGRYHGFVRPEE